MTRENQTPEETHGPPGDGGQAPPFMFPRGANALRSVVATVAVVAPLYLTSVVWYGFSPKTIDVGYAPEQPVPYSHALHVGELGMDCRYCHTGVEKTPHASIPSTQICMNCHHSIRGSSPKLAPVRESHASGQPIHWVRVHDLPDYAYFDHSAHVARGVGCASCHGRVDKMEVVSQIHPLSMGWCLECHRNPSDHVRPRQLVTQMNWQPEKRTAAQSKAYLASHSINPSQDCSTCHR